MLTINTRNRSLCCGLSRRDLLRVGGAGLFGTSAFSEVLDIIDGGEPAVALHGTNQPELLGEALSRGCIRVADEVIELLISLTLPLGTPVEILA